MAGAAAFPHQGWGPTGLAANADTDPGDVGDAPAGLLVPADGPLAFSDTAQLDGFPLPAVEAKDAVRLLDRNPTFQIIQGTACLGAGLDVARLRGAARAADCSGERRPAGAAEAVAGTSGSWGLVGRSTAGMAGASTSARRRTCRADGLLTGLAGVVGLDPLAVGMVLFMAWGGALGGMDRKGMGPGFLAWPLSREP